MDKKDSFWRRGFNAIRHLARPRGGKMKNGKRQLWGQEFNIVKKGLAEEEVTKFVTDLMSKYRALAEQREHILSLGTLSEKAAIEADKVAADIKARAEREAEAEAASIIAKANQRAREMMAEAKRAAQEATQKEVEGILLAARRKAAIIETEAKQQAQLYLIRSREAIQGELKDEVKEAYNRILSALQDLLAEGHDVEAEWTDKTTELWKRETFELEGYEAVPSSLAAEIAETPPLIGVEGEVEIGLPEKGASEREEEVIGEVSPLEAVAEEFMAPPEMVKAVAEEFIAPPEMVEAVAEERPPEEVRPEFVPPELRPQTIYEGEVELSLVLPIDLAVFSKIYGLLESIPEVKFLRTVGSWDKGTTITFLLEKPLPLVDMLTKIPMVEAISEDKSRGRSRIALKTQSS